MSAYIYLFQERIIYWTPQTLYSKPVAVQKVKWYSITGAIPMPLNDMVTRGNVGYSMQKGFYTVEGELPPNWDEREGLIKQLQILAGLNTITNTQRAKYTDNSIGQPLMDVLLVDEIRQYRKNGSLDECTIITSLLETDEQNLTPDALVTKLWLQYESYRTVISYLNRLEFKVRQLLRDHEYDKANDLIAAEVEKMRI
ncbi:MAG: hypothetical protein SFW65_05555 [Alphaproteobacteria bacterium]|nr:hypothetical protein [Alphaproteobacteria bacterium]